jgi:hypothetical protein
MPPSKPNVFMVSLVMDELWKDLRVIAGLRTNWKGLLCTEGNGQTSRSTKRTSITL